MIRKFVMLSALVGLTANAFAGAPDFECVNNKSGQRFVILSRYGELYVYNKKGKELFNKDGFSVNTLQIETFPPQVTYQLIDDEGEIFGTISEKPILRNGQVAGVRLSLTSKDYRVTGIPCAKIR